MADEELAQDALAMPASDPVPEPETPEPETPEVDGEEGQTDDEVEFEAEDGSKYRLPKALEPYLLRNKDYTQKTQAAAEERRALEAERAQIEERSRATEEELTARAELMTVSKELDRFKDFSFQAWQQARQTDPMAADEAWNYANYLRSQKAELEGKLGTVQQQRTEKAQQDLAKRVQETAAWAAREIPNWKPELTDQLVQFARESGVPDAALQANWGPTFYKLLHRAHLGEQLLKKQSAPKAPTPPPPPIKVVKGRSTPEPTALSDDLPIDEWNRRRELGLRKKGRG